MTIYLATDNAGFELKEKIKKFLVDSGHTVEDCGAHTLNPDDDYPDFIRIAAEKVAKNPGSRGIILGGSGQGEAMVANRVLGIRATVFYGFSQEIITLSRTHNDANILSLGSRFLTINEATEAVQLWLSTAFSEDPRHKRRIAKF